MKIYNTVPYFLENYLPTVEYLNHYHEVFAPHFKEYFLYHCKDADEKIKNAIQKYPSQMSGIKEANAKIENLIQQVVTGYEQKYHVELTEDVHIIVGAYGSNAFTHRQINPEVTFCLEKLSSNEKHLKVIIAHEFGHALHNMLSDQEGMDWSELQWLHPFTTLLQEGCATYFSEQITAAEKSVYFSYDDNGEEWLQFVEKNKSEIIHAFLEDLQKCSNSEIFREWFSINGGLHFGYTRLAYFIGYSVLQSLIEKYQEKKAVTIWKDPGFHEEIEKVLLDLAKGSC
ncbi:DUF5700 domain-containing putative Zn-dependent protease [Oceanobacillus neutriphilus]|uniref:Aminopeptidase n=1 Tax=Oceanobacillus neutriphilus TaxID=531815 RepID=A0ABQ2P2E3_9BACI|nr:DUF5700 domain-containing putative Zn-dependent protease [Oceanobacillus neutriphilus]GGP16410.1 hypothetical protein GCM10011346_48350 [Oceanobacillus neutriphilus]